MITSSVFVFDEVESGIVRDEVLDKNLVASFGNFLLYHETHIVALD